MKTSKHLVSLVAFSSLLYTFILSTSTSAAGMRRGGFELSPEINRSIEAEKSLDHFPYSQREEIKRNLRKKFGLPEPFDGLNFDGRKKQGENILKGLIKSNEIEGNHKKRRLTLPPRNSKDSRRWPNVVDVLRRRYDNNLLQYEFPDVRRAQEFLEKAGYNPGRPDGIVGSKTEHALQEYQKSRQLPENGKLDNETWRSLVWDTIDFKDLLHSQNFKQIIPERYIVNELRDELNLRTSSMIVTKDGEMYSLKFNVSEELDFFEKGPTRFNAEMESRIANESTADISFVYIHDESTVQIANNKASLQTLVNLVNENFKETKGPHSFVIRSSGNNALDINLFHSLEEIIEPWHRVYIDDNMELAKKNISIQPLITSLNQIGVLVDPGIGVKDWGIHEFISEGFSDSFRLIREDQIVEVNGIILFFGHKNTEYVRHLRSLAEKKIFSGKTIVSFSCGAPEDKTFNSEIIQKWKAASVISYSDFINPEMVKEVLSQMVDEVKENHSNKGFTVDELIRRAVVRSEEKVQNPKMKIELKKIRPITQISHLYNDLLAGQKKTS